MNDKNLRQDVVDELDYEPSIDSADIGVAVADGVVTLTGKVPNFAQRFLAEQAVRRVKGVRGIAEDIKVSLFSDPFSDDDIARRSLTVLDLNVLVPAGKILVKAEKGWLTLTGEVEWDYQRNAAVDDLRKLRGVVGISNQIVVKTRADAGDIKRRIVSALERSAAVEASAIKVNVEGGRVRLEGRVDTWTDRNALERAAWASPGVHEVNDFVTVHP